MGIPTILILLPGLLAFGISKVLSRSKSRPINEVVIDLVLQTVFVFQIYYLLSGCDFLNLPKFSEIAVASFKIKDGISETDLKSSVDTLETALFPAAIIAFIVGSLGALSMPAAHGENSPQDFRLQERLFLTEQLLIFRIP